MDWKIQYCRDFNYSHIGLWNQCRMALTAISEITYIRVEGQIDVKWEGEGHVEMTEVLNQGDWESSMTLPNSSCPFPDFR